MDAELRQVANGFDNKVRVFEKYDINGYRFRTVDKERKMADRKSTNSGVSAVGDGGIEYYGRVEAIYELLFYGENPPNVVVFKCHWFLPSRTRRTHEHVGLVEIRQDTHLNVPDVYITAQQATQVFYISYPCQTVKNLKGWDVIYDVPPHIRPPPPNEEDYVPHIDPETYEGEFFQETRVIKNFSETALRNPRTWKKTMRVNQTMMMRVNPLTTMWKSLKKKRLLLQKTCQCLTVYIKALEMLVLLNLMRP